MQMRHRLRLFQLADACLASGMVPAYTAAAFIKRFARLALTASPAGECPAEWPSPAMSSWTGVCTLNMIMMRHFSCKR